MAEVLAQFEEIWFVDFEFISKPGQHPDVVCLVARELRSGQTIRLWRDQLGDAPPYRIDAKALFVCFTATAECACHLALGWPLPANVLDLSPVFRCVVNGRDMPHGKGLLGALAYYGLPAVSAKYKDAMRRSHPTRAAVQPGREREILTYCEGDVTRRQICCRSCCRSLTSISAARCTGVSLLPCPRLWSTAASRSTWR